LGEHWEIFAALAALVATWSLVTFGVMRTIMSKCVADMERKIGALADIGKDYQNVERSLLELKAELPVHYVRREDFIRFDTVINVKLDRLHDLIEEIRGKK
jgi:hypothetical protein